MSLATESISGSTSVELVGRHEKSLTATKTELLPEPISDKEAVPLPMAADCPSTASRNRGDT